MTKYSGQRSWLISIFMLALILSVPTIVIFGAWSIPKGDVWSHLIETVLTDYISNTFILALGVALTSGFVGTMSAWFVSQYHFPGRDAFRWMLFLPLAFPPYIMGYTYTGIFEFSGPLQSLIRDVFDLSYGEYWFPQMQSLPGAIFVISIVLFPYVYGLALVAFSGLSQNHFEMSKLHGLSEFQYFKRIALPLSLPAISAGCLLTMMEALADFGTVEYMGVSTFATGIFRTWFGMNEPVVAAQLSATLVCFVLFVLFLEQWSRRKQRFYQSRVSQAVNKRHTSKIRGYAMSAAVFSLFAIAFLIPLSQIVYWSILVLREGTDLSRLLGLMWNSFSVAGLAALVVLFIALIYGYAMRINRHFLITAATQISSVGYAFPGAVIAVGAVIALGTADRTLNQIVNNLFDVRIGLFFSGTLFALIFAYTVRYLTVGLQYVRSGLQQISPSLDHAAKSLGHSSLGVLSKVHLPLLRNSIFVGLLMVFVDVLKELPATLILRPFNFDTLAVRTYELASDERLTDAALPALLIVLVGLIPVWFIQKNVKT